MRWMILFLLLLGCTDDPVESNVCDDKDDGYFDSRDACLNRLAQENDDRLLCDEIEKEDFRENCYENT